MISFFRSLPKAHDHGWGLERRLTGKALPSGSAPSSPQQLNCCHCTTPAVHLTLHFALACEQDPEILDSLALGSNSLTWGYWLIEKIIDKWINNEINQYCGCSPGSCVGWHQEWYCLHSAALTQPNYILYTFHFIWITSSQPEYLSGEYTLLVYSMYCTFIQIKQSKQELMGKRPQCFLRIRIYLRCYSLPSLVTISSFTSLSMVLKRLMEWF